MDKEEVRHIFKSMLEYEFGNECVTDLRINVSETGNVVSFQGTFVTEGEDNE